MILISCIDQFKESTKSTKKINMEEIHLIQGAELICLGKIFNDMVSMDFGVMKR